MWDTSSVSQFCLSWVRCFTEQSLNDVDPKHPYLDGSYDDTSITRWWPNLDISACQPAKKTIAVKVLTLWSLSACVSSVIERRKPDRRISFLIQTDIISDEPWIEVIRLLTRLFFFTPGIGRDGFRSPTLTPRVLKVWQRNLESQKYVLNCLLKSQHELISLYNPIQIGLFWVFGGGELIRPPPLNSENIKAMTTKLGGQIRRPKMSPLRSAT